MHGAPKIVFSSGITSNGVNRNFKDDNQTQGWDGKKDRHHILECEGETDLSENDPDSIMHYPIPKNLTLEGFSVSWNCEVSKPAEAFMRKHYP